MSSSLSSSLSWICPKHTPGSLSPRPRQCMHSFVTATLSASFGKSTPLSLMGLGPFNQVRNRAGTPKDSANRSRLSVMTTDGGRYADWSGGWDKTGYGVSLPSHTLANQTFLTVHDHEHTTLVHPILRDPAQPHPRYANTKNPRNCKKPPPDIKKSAAVVFQLWRICAFAAEHVEHFGVIKSSPHTAALILVAGWKKIVDATLPHSSSSRKHLE